MNKYIYNRSCGKPMPISIIVALDENNLIGNDDKLPWKNKEDMKYFKNTTMGCTVIMGRKTYESIRKPLIDRVNIILTRDPEFKVKDDDIHIAYSVDDAITTADCFNPGMDIFIVGGRQIYELFLPIADLLYVTRIQGKFEGNIYFPEIDPNDWTLFDSQEGETCIFEIYSKN